LKNDKTIIAYHFRQLPKIEIDWLIKVLRNECFHNGPVICPRLSHNGPRKVVLALGAASGQYNLHWAIMTNLGHITGPLWKHPFINTIITNWRVSLSKICHEWPNDAVTHECAQRMSEIQYYLIMSDIFL
jgi:hypothetical protein